VSTRTRSPGLRSSSSPGLRKGEFLDLTVDSVVQIGATYWLRVPLGKLRTDRYIPLHTQLKELLDEWVASRPAGLREPWLFIERGRRIGKQRVGDAIANAADAAGIGRVTRTSFGTRSRPRRSTAACHSKRSPRCSGTTRCG
jgi:integrase